MRWVQLCGRLSILWDCLFGIGMKTDLFQSCGHCWVFQICWHIECRTSTASSFRIWNSSTGILSPPLALFIVILPKAHLTSHSRMSGSRWVITSLWLSGSWRSFLYSSSVHSCHLFLISSASVRSIPFMSFTEPIFVWNVPLVSSFPEEISSLSHSVVLLYFFALIAEEGFLISPCYSLELCIQMGVLSNVEGQKFVLSSSLRIPDPSLLVDPYTSYQPAREMTLAGMGYLLTVAQEPRSHRFTTTPASTTLLGLLCPWTCGITSQLLPRCVATALAPLLISR